MHAPYKLGSCETVPPSLVPRLSTGAPAPPIRLPATQRPLERHAESPPPAHHNLRSLVVKHHPSHRRLHTIAAPEFYPTPTRNPNLFSASSAQTLRIRDETLCTILSQPLLFRSSEAKFSPTPNSIIGRWVAFSYTRWTNYYLANPPSGAIMPANYLQSLTLLSGCKIPARPPASHKRGDSV